MPFPKENYSIKFPINLGCAKDCFDEIDDRQAEFVKTLVSHHHYRNGVRHEDGSMGTVRMSPKQLRDLLSFAIYAVNRVI